MLFDQLQLEALKSQLVQKYSQQSYVETAIARMADMLRANPNLWQHFGPYWPLVQRFILDYKPEMTAMAMDWGVPPDYLSHYNYGDDMLNAIACLQYLNRDGEYMAPLGHPHSISLADGSMALYSPTLGIIES